MIIASPKDEQSCVRSSAPRSRSRTRSRCTIRAIRASAFPERTPEILPIGVGEVLSEGNEILIVGFGPIVERGRQAAELLAIDGWSVGVLNARYAKPLDRQ